MKRPNVVFVFGDQHRWCDTGYAGNPQVQTPFLDSMQQESCEFTHAVSSMPVCCAYRATLMTGQHPQTHGVFLNDVCLNTGGPYLGEMFRDNGYQTAYVGKWHIDGHGRSAFIPKERRRGFDYWQVLECSHDYNHSAYYGDEPVKQYWEGYDAFAQTDRAADYIRNYHDSRPFFLILSYGPPHNPYDTAPEEFKALYNPADIQLRENVPPEEAEQARAELAGYYAHISALDHAMEGLNRVLAEKGIEDDTIFIYTSDHGDMLHSQGQQRKQRPWEEAIRVPFLMKYPALFGKQHCENPLLFDAADIMPTLLDLCGIAIPDTVEGRSFAPYLRGENPDFASDAVVLECVSPFGEFTRQNGGREYRGIRTNRYTYVADLNGPWLLYDNEQDPVQLHNLAGEPQYAELVREMDALLRSQLVKRKDEFLPGEAYIEKWGYPVDSTGTVPYTN